MRSSFFIFFAWLIAGAATFLEAQTAPSWSGRWQGTLVNLPARTGAPSVDVAIEIGPLPVSDSTCVPWKTTYSEQGAVRGVKDYQLCRGQGAADLYVDEGPEGRLSAQLLGDVLVSAFKVGKVLLVTHLRVRGDTLDLGADRAEILGARRGLDLHERLERHVDRQLVRHLHTFAMQQLPIFVIGSY